MTEEETKSGDRLIAKFMGYIYYHKGIYDEWTEYGGNEYKEIFSKVPIEVDEHDGDYFKEMPNPDFGNNENPKWSPHIETLSWYSLNFGNFIYDLKYHTDLNQLMEVVEHIEKGNYGFKMCREVVEVYYDDSKEVILKTKEDCRFNSLYKAVVEFIKLHNEGKLI